jgi:RNA polymerase sigma-70 factor (ECF subfamily)
MSPGNSVEHTVQLIEEMQNGSSPSFAELYRLYYPLVNRVISRKCSNACDVDDLIQETFIQVFMKIATLHKPASFVPWLLAITDNKIKNYYRGQPKNLHLENMTQYASSSSIVSLQHLQAADDVRQIHYALQTLKLADSNTLIDFYWRGLSIRDIAKEQAAPLSTIRRRLFVARQRIARYLR